MVSVLVISNVTFEPIIFPSVEVVEVVSLVEEVESSGPCRAHGLHSHRASILFPSPSMSILDGLRVHRAREGVLGDSSRPTL